MQFEREEQGRDPRRGFQRGKPWEEAELDYDLLADKIALRLFAMLINANKEKP